MADPHVWAVVGVRLPLLEYAPGIPGEIKAAGGMTGVPRLFKQHLVSA
jgi:hypothetical protein